MRAAVSIALLLSFHAALARAEVGPVARLKQGGAAFRAGSYAEARRALLPLQAQPGLRSRDYALYLLAESELLLAHEGRDRDRHARAAHEHFLALSKLGGSRFVQVARARAAEGLLLLGRDNEARTLLLPLAKTPPAELDAAVLHLRLAEIATRADRRPEARTLLRRVYTEHPTHPLAEVALARLRTLDEATRLQAAERISRARALIQGRRWQLALDELKEVPPDVGQALRDEVDYLVGTAHYRMRRGYDIAAQKLLGVAARLRGERQAEAMFHGARALSRADQDDAAISAYREVVKAHPGSRWAAEAAFLSGWLDFNRGRYQQAIPALLSTVRRFPGPFGEDARWYLAFSRYLLGECDQALPDLREVGRRSGMHGDKGRYFQALCLLRLSRRGEAVELLRKLVTGRPLSYYALLARVRLRDLSIAAAPFDEAPPAFAPLKEPPEELSREPALLRVDELIAAGLLPEAGYELRRAEGGLISRYTAGRSLPLLFDRYVKAQNWHRPHLLAESYGAAALHHDPHRTKAARPFWEQVYPLAYRELVEKYGPTGDSPPRYLYTIMQKESAYNPHDVSYADAIGLLQMIPPTSQRVARHIGRPYTDDVLYDPEGNIQFGAWYIGRLLRKFKGQIALGAGSFNAGPRAMIRWLAQNGDRPLDEFIELCAYTQTREYMKKVLDIYAHYVYLWDQEEYLPSLKVDKSYLTDDGIDY